MHTSVQKILMVEVLSSTLSKSGLDDYHNGYGVHPLHVAVAEHNHGALDVLIEHYSTLAAKYPVSNLDDKSNTKYQLTASPILPILDGALRFGPFYIPFVSSRFATSNYLGCAPLHIAALADNETAVRVLLKAGTTVDVEDAGFNTALHLAAGYGSATMVRLLLEHGANTQRRNCRHQTPVLLAARQENIAAVQELDTDGIPWADTDIFGRNVLEYTLNHSSGLDYVLRSQQLVPNGGLARNSSFGHACKYIAPISRREVDQNPLLFAKLLQRSSIHIYNHYPPSWIPQSTVAVAAMTGNIGLLRQLVKAEESPSVLATKIRFDSSVENPLIAACLGGRLEIVKFLVRFVSSANNEALCDPVTMHHAWSASTHFPEIHSWLLIERYTDQRKIPAATSGDAEKQREYRPWSGLEPKELPLKRPLWRFCHESMFKYAVRLRQIEKRLRGHVLTLDPARM